MTPKLKVCGINDAEFAKYAELGGVDYLGFIFAEKSPRYVSPERAGEIIAALKGSAKRVGVFISEEKVVEIAKKLKFDVIQLHFSATSEFVEELKALGFEVWGLNGPDNADAILLDGVSGSQTGGTGKEADRSRIPELKAANKKVVLAGGLSVDNLAAAKSSLADILDFNSSLEIARGKKSAAKLDELLKIY